MQNNYSILGIPSFARREAYDFGVDIEDLRIFEELNQVAEEIERCRSEHS